MSTNAQQPAGLTSNPVKKAIIVAIATMVSMTILFYLPYNRFTVILTAGFAIFVIAYLYFLSREFGLWCLRMAGAALGAVATLNIVPGISIFAKWGDATLWAKIEGRHWAIDLGLLATAVAFGYIAYLYRRLTPNKAVSNTPTMQIKKVSGNPTGLNSPGVVMGDVTYDQSGAKLDDETLNAIVKQQLKSIEEKDDKLSEKDVRISNLESENEELIQKQNEGVARVEHEAEKGEQAAKEAIEELRKSGDTEKLQRVLEKEADQHKDDFIERCLEIAAIAFLRGDIDTARKRVEDVLKLDPDELRALNQLGHIESLQGNLEAAESAYRRILNVGEQTSNLDLIATASGNLGIVLRTRGDLDGSEKNLYKAVEIHEKLNHLEGMASDCSNLGTTLRKRGDSIGAEKMYRQSLVIEKKLGRLEGMANNYSGLGNVLRMRGDLDGAEKMFRQSLEIHIQLGHLVGIATNYGNIGSVYRIRDDKNNAKEYWIKARDLFRQIGMQLELEKVQRAIDELENPDATE